MQALFRLWTFFLLCGSLFIVSQTEASESLCLSDKTVVPSLLVQSPTHVRGQQRADKFLTQTDLVNIIRWAPPISGPSPVAYKIFRDSELTKLAATIPASKTLIFEDHNRKKNHTYAYFLVSIDVAGKQSAPIGIIFKDSKTHLVKAKKKLVFIEVVPIGPTVAVDFQQQFTAIGLFSDNSIQDITTQVTWSSSNTAVASISNGPDNGLATALTAGTTEIVASLQGVTGSSTLTVTAATLVSIAVTPFNQTIASGLTEQFTAVGVFSDGTIEVLTHQVVWSSSNPGVASISTTGLATGIAPGTTQIQANLNNITGSTSLTVSAAQLTAIDVTPVNPFIAAGFTQQFTATGLFSDHTTEDLTTQVSWTSSNAAIASISATGLATSVRAGATEITAALGSISGSTLLTVSSAVLTTIEVTPVNASVAVGFTEQYTATGVFSDQSTQNLTSQVTWSSSDENVAIVSNTNPGLATCLSPGQTTISASMRRTPDSVLISGSATLTVSGAVLTSILVEPANKDLPVGLTKQYTATGIFSDGTSKNITKDVLWSSSQPTFATISNALGAEGKASALSPGTTVITARTLNREGMLVSGSTNLEVTAALLLFIIVEPTNPAIHVGITQNFTATGLYDNGRSQNITDQVEWTSSDDTVASISNHTGTQGVAVGLSPGTTTITAARNGIHGSTILTVNSTLNRVITIQTIDPGGHPIPPTVPVGLPIQFQALGTYNGQPPIDITSSVLWSSSDPTIASISNTGGTTGQATGLGVGMATVTATFSDGLQNPVQSNPVQLTVTAAVLTSIAVNPPNPAVAAGVSQQFTAIGTFSDSSTSDITNVATWTSTDLSVVTISNAIGSQGLATTFSPGGTALITAELQGITGSTPLTVTSAVLDSITVTPANATINAGATTPYTATGNFSDSTTVNLTSQVVWSSANTGIAQVTSAGIVTGGPLTGSTTIIATYTPLTGMNIVGSTSVTVACPTFTINNRLPGGAVGFQYSQLIGTPGGVPPMSFSQQGQACTTPGVVQGLPQGLKLQTNGQVVGTPVGSFRQMTTFCFPVQVTSSCGTMQTGQVSISIAPAGP